MTHIHHMLITSIATTILSGCASINAEAPIGKGYKFQMESIGSKAELTSHCLTPEQIKVISLGQIPPDAPKLSCYQVYFLSSSGSSVTGAMHEFLNARDEFDLILAEILKATSPKDAAQKIPPTATINNKQDINASNSVVTDVTSAILQDALSKEPQEVIERSKAVSQQLSEDQSKEVIKILSEVKETTNLEEVKENIDAATKSILEDI